MNIEYKNPTQLERSCLFMHIMQLIISLLCPAKISVTYEANLFHYLHSQDSMKYTPTHLSHQFITCEKNYHIHNSHNLVLKLQVNYRTCWMP